MHHLLLLLCTIVITVSLNRPSHSRNTRHPCPFIGIHKHTRTLPLPHSMYYYITTLLSVTFMVTASVQPLSSSDKNPSAEASESFKLVKQAFEVLSNPAKRLVYDLSGVEGINRAESLAAMETQKTARRVSIVLPDTYVNLSQSPSQRDRHSYCSRRESLAPLTPPRSARTSLPQPYIFPIPGYAGSRVMHNLYEPPRWMVKEFEAKQLATCISNKELERSHSLKLQRQNEELEERYHDLISSLRTQRDYLRRSINPIESS